MKWRRRVRHLHSSRRETRRERALLRSLRLRLRQSAERIRRGRGRLICARSVETAARCHLEVLFHLLEVFLLNANTTLQVERKLVTFYIDVSEDENVRLALDQAETLSARRLGVEADNVHRVDFPVSVQDLHSSIDTLGGGQLVRAK